MTRAAGMRTCAAWMHTPGRRCIDRELDGPNTGDNSPALRSIPHGQVVASDHHPQKRSPRSNGEEREARPANQGEGHESQTQAMTRGCGDAHARKAPHGCTRREGAALIGNVYGPNTGDNSSALRSTPLGQVIASDHHSQMRNPRSNGKKREARPADQGEGHESQTQAMTRGCGDAHARKAPH